MSFRWWTARIISYLLFLPLLQQFLSLLCTFQCTCSLCLELRPRMRDAFEEGMTWTISKMVHLHLIVVSWMKIKYHRTGQDGCPNLGLVMTIESLLCHKWLEFQPNTMKNQGRSFFQTAPVHMNIWSGVYQEEPTICWMELLTRCQSVGFLLGRSCFWEGNSLKKGSAALQAVSCHHAGKILQRWLEEYQIAGFRQEKTGGHLQKMKGSWQRIWFWRTEKTNKETCNYQAHREHLWLKKQTFRMDPQSNREKQTFLENGDAHARTRLTEVHRWSSLDLNAGSVEWFSPWIAVWVLFHCGTNCNFTYSLCFPFCLWSCNDILFFNYAI